MKFFQIRDDGTHIPAMAIQFVPTEGDRELRRAGFAVGTKYTLLTDLSALRTEYDPERWSGSRTLRVAHRWIHDSFAELASGAVVDVEYILKERETIKEPE
jgi:hypothetical protein